MVAKKFENEKEENDFDSPPPSEEEEIIEINKDSFMFKIYKELFSTKCMNPVLDCAVNKTPENILSIILEVVTNENNHLELCSIINKYTDQLLESPFKPFVCNVENLENTALICGFQLLSDPNYKNEIYSAIKECVDEYKISLIKII